MPYDPNDPNSPYYSSSAYTADQNSQSLGQQAADLTQKIALGEVTPDQAQHMLPDNTHLQNGIVVPNDPSMLPLFIMAAAVAAPFAVQGLTSLLGPAADTTASGASFGTVGDEIPSATAAAASPAETTSPGIFSDLFGPTSGTATPSAAALPADAAGNFNPAYVYGQGTSAANAGADSAAATGSSGMNLGSIFKSIDPTTAILGALSLFKAPVQQYRQSYSNPGAITDPQQSLYQALQGTYRLGAGLEQRQPVQLRSSYVQAPPSPINIPGLPFQIGGGMGTDPALANPDLLTSHANDGVTQFGPFQGIAQRTQQGLVK